MFDHSDLNRVRLIMIGVVVGLAALFGVAMPMLGSHKPGGDAANASAWVTPNRVETVTATATLQPSPVAANVAPDEPGPPLVRVATDDQGDSRIKMGYVVGATATPEPILLVSLPLPAAASWTPTEIDVPRWQDRATGASSQDSAGTLSDDLLASQTFTVAVPIPVLRVPNAGLAPAHSVAAQPPITPTPAAKPVPSASSAAISGVTAESVRAAVPPGQSVQPAVVSPAAPAQVTQARPAAALSVVAPELVSPQPDARLSGMTTFEWRPVAPLPHGLAYEIVVWSPELNPGQARGIAPATIMTSQQVNLDPLFDGGQFRMGNFYWTVLVVQQDPYLRLTSPGASESRYLVRRTGG
ncbi:MAG: hypothetical protein R2844_04750 [Caldilineales bacterium]